ncbi:MAG: hypothetical protein HY246_11740 [Proteobacteria bacterium]|nr:hypothetical protein [Pseudomonadota bacterium]
MSAPATILRESWGLFVDDGTLAAVLIVWIGIVAMASASLPFPRGWQALILLLGCLAILVENVLRAARRS